MNPLSFMLIGFGFTLATAFGVVMATDPMAHVSAHQFEKHQSR